MNFYIHLAFVILAGGYFLFRFIKDRRAYELVLLLWIPSTLLAYLSSNRTFLLILSGIQVVLFCVVIFLLFRRRKTETTHVLDTLKEMTDTSASSDSSTEDSAAPTDKID